MTDSSIPDVPAFADALSPLERAALGLQQDELTVFEIGLATYPKKEAYQDRKRLTDFLLDAIKAGRLHADGDPNGWRTTAQFSPDGEAQNKGPFPFAQPHQGTRRTLRTREQLVESRFGSVRIEEQDWHGDNCLVAWSDYQMFLAIPAARGIPEPNWRAYPRLSDTISYADAKARLGASDADMCGWTLDRGFRPNERLVAYQQFNGRLSEFDWSNAAPDFPWLDQLAVLRFSRAEVEHFHPDPDPAVRYLTYLEAVERIQKTHPQLPSASIENRLMSVAMAKPGELNFDLVARDPLARIRKSNRQHFPECLFIETEVDQFARRLGEDQSTAPASSAPTLPQGEPAPLPQGEPGKPESGAADSQNPVAMRQRVTDKARFLDLATWKGTQQATVNQHPEAAYFKGKYDTPALLKWASEIDPRPKDQRGGRPRKT